MSDYVEHSDGEINEQTIPPRVWERLTRADHLLHTSTMHRGNISREFIAYADGVADALEIDEQDLIDRVRSVDGTDK